MKVLWFFLEMQLNKPFYTLIRESVCNISLSDNERLEMKEKADDMNPELYNLFFELNSVEYIELIGFIRNN